MPEPIRPGLPEIRPKHMQAERAEPDMQGAFRWLLHPYEVEPCLAEGSPDQAPLLDVRVGLPKLVFPLESHEQGSRTSPIGSDRSTVCPVSQKPVVA